MSDAAPDVGTRFGPYLLKRLIGSGGMGRVYEAEDTAMDRVVALKLISGIYAQDGDYRKRLQREARIAGRLQDPHVVPIHAAGEIDGQLYVDMRLINGTDLDTMLRHSGPLAPARAVAIVRQIASALDAAHAAGVMHRDVKPGNILITADDFAYLVDFGIANAATEEKLTHMGDVLGTWTYMAPERFSGDNTKVTPSADIYALACVLFEALTGSPPFAGDRVSVVGAHLSQPIPRASSHARIPPALDDVISRGMAKRPEGRYATAGELAQAAEVAVASDATLSDVSAQPTAPVPHTPTNTAAPTVSMPYRANGGATGPPIPPPGSPPSQWPHQWTPPPTSAPGSAPISNRRRRWILIAAAAVLVVAVAGGLGIWGLTGGRSTQVHSSTPAVDISKLDVGHYGTKPRILSGPTTGDQGKFLEAFRLAEGIANPFEVDPKLDHLYGGATPDPKLAATSISGTGTPLVQPVLEKYGMISAYMVQGYSTRIQDFVRTRNGEALLVLLMSFPNDDAAARAATEMDAADFAVNPDNQHATIPGYPQAKAHYRPGYSSVASTMAHGRLVVSTVASSSTATDLNYFLQRVQRLFDVQVPLMDQLIPVTDAGLTSLPLDPDHMLTRAFVAGEQPKISDLYGSIGPRAVVFCADTGALKEGLLAQAGVDRCAFTPDSQLLRAQDESAASGLLPKLVQANAEDLDHDVASPDGLNNARCFEQKQEVWSDNAQARFGCGVSFGRYVAFVWSNEEKDARQRAAAQYAILVNSE
jgi:serine/threonine kinase PknH